MRTAKLYYQDGYKQECPARVLEVIAMPDGKWSIELHQTVFYPEGGGQPCDLGTLDDIPVEQVIEKDGRILHITSRMPSTEMLMGRIDWKRRFDHMQQHSGEHILSWAFAQVMQATNIGFHLGSDITYIDIDVTDISVTQIHEVEALANQAVVANKLVIGHIVTKDELAKFTLRKNPVKEYSSIRIVEMAESDCCPCGGTHVSSTGEVGLIKICDWERKNKASRIYFVCGRRALTDYQEKNEIVRYLSRSFTAPVKGIVEAYEKQKERMAEISHQLAEQRKVLHNYLTRELWEQSTAVGNFQIISRIFKDTSPQEATDIAKLLTTKPNTIALLGCTQPDNSRVNLIFACSEDVSLNMGRELKQIMAIVGGKGGGSARFAQGAIDSVDHILSVLEQAQANVIKDLQRL